MLKRVLTVGAISLALPAAAEARDPGRWLLTGVSSVPIQYWQGLSDDRAGNVFFAGVFEGLWRTGPRLGQRAGTANAIPAGVKLAEGYNHIGDPSWDSAEGGRLLLPLECFVPGQGNTCGTGSIGVADPTTLAFRYYVKLDPAEIPKAMWVERSPDGSLLWTSSGNDLLAYRAADVSPANAAPGAAPIRAVRRLAGAVPPSGITGAVFRRGRLLLSGYTGGPFRLWSVDLATGRRRLEIERSIRGESEGLGLMRTLGGELHWLVAPVAAVGRPTFGPTSALMHFVPARGRSGLRVRVARHPLEGRGAARAGHGARHTAWQAGRRRRAELRRRQGAQRPPRPRHAVRILRARRALQGAGGQARAARAVALRKRAGAGRVRE